MKNAPELDPELCGLLTEIAADPRSRLRLAPRHALRSWYLTGETIPARPHDATAAERHLLAAHREALAALYCEASALAYWQSPRWSSRRPQFVIDGHVDSRMESTQDRITLRSKTADRLGTKADGRSLAEAALLLVPSDTARLCLAFYLRDVEPRSALQLLLQIVDKTTREDVRVRALSAAGATAVAIERMDLAFDLYESHARFTSGGLPWVLNIALALGKKTEAVRCMHQIDEWNPSGVLLMETMRVVREWLLLPSQFTANAREQARELRSTRGVATERILNEYT